MILILGGTAAYHLDLAHHFASFERVDLNTPYGPAFPILISPTKELAFASRHGLQHLEVTPPFVNAHANIWAAHSLGVHTILSWNGVGAINPLLEVNDVLVLDGLIDATRFRNRQPFSGAAPPPRTLDTWLAPPHHSPFDHTTRAALFESAHHLHTRTFPCGVYACSEGPRLETSAEIQMFRTLGADVAGMTLVPEVFLAQELGIAFAALAFVTNYATGLTPTPNAPRNFGVGVAEQCLATLRGAAGLLISCR